MTKPKPGAPRRERKMPPEQRFWLRVRKTDGCWEWTGLLWSSGYGVLSAAPNTRVAAHRFSYELHFGPVPDGLFVCHTCDNRICVRPDHLWLGTNKDNLSDMTRKGRRRNQNTGRQYCRRGHLLEGENVIVYPANNRRCRECRRMTNREWWRRRRGKGTWDE